MSLRAVLGILVLVLGVSPMWAEDLAVQCRTRVLKLDAGGHNQWQVVETRQLLKPQETAIIICDMWDKHWSRGATERVAQMAPPMNEVVKAARARGVTIIHCPSDTMKFYQDSPARKRVLAAPAVPLPTPSAHDDPPQPIDASDQGSDTNEKKPRVAWTRQHAAIEIDPQRDGISDNGQEVWNFLRQKGINNVVVMGVHTNMCILGRSFAIKALVRRGMNVMLVRDLTDAMYNPARPPYVSHEEGTQLVIQYIERFWCPSIDSADLLGVTR